MAGKNFAFMGQHEGVFDNIDQFPHVSGPRVVHQEVEGLFTESAYVFPAPYRNPFDKGVDE